MLNKVIPTAVREILCLLKIKDILRFFAGWGLVTCIQYPANYRNQLFRHELYKQKSIFLAHKTSGARFGKPAHFYICLWCANHICRQIPSRCGLKLSMSTWVHRKMRIASVFGTKIKTIKLSWWNKCCCFSMHSKGLIFTPYFWTDMWEQSSSL